AEMQILINKSFPSLLANRHRLFSTFDTKSLSHSTELRPPLPILGVAGFFICSRIADGNGFRIFRRPLRRGHRPNASTMLGSDRLREQFPSVMKVFDSLSYLPCTTLHSWIDPRTVIHVLFRNYEFLI